MKNIKALTLAFLLTLFGSSQSLAEYGFTVGITGSMAMIEASGQETEGGEVSRGEVSNNVGVASFFLEYNDILGSGLSFGVDFIPGSADVSSSFSQIDMDCAFPSSSKFLRWSSPLISAFPCLIKINFFIFVINYLEIYCLSNYFF